MPIQIRVSTRNEFTDHGIAIIGNVPSLYNAIARGYIPITDRCWFYGERMKISDEIRVYMPKYDLWVSEKGGLYSYEEYPLRNKGLVNQLPRKMATPIVTPNVLTAYLARNGVEVTRDFLKGLYTIEFLGPREYYRYRSKFDNYRNPSMNPFHRVLAMTAASGYIFLYSSLAPKDHLYIVREDDIFNEFKRILEVRGKNLVNDLKNIVNVISQNGGINNSIDVNTVKQLNPFFLYIYHRNSDNPLELSTDRNYYIISNDIVANTLVPGNIEVMLGLSGFKKLSRGVGIDVDVNNISMVERIREGYKHIWNEVVRGERTLAR